jgi:hypothetical protein
MMSLVPLQFQLLHVPVVNLSWYFISNISDIEASDTSKKFSLFIARLPVLELPVLPIDEDGHDSLPPGLCEVLHRVVHVEGNLLVANLMSHLNDLRVPNRSALFRINSIFKECFDIGESKRPRHLHSWYNNHRTGHLGCKVRSYNKRKLKLDRSKILTACASVKDRVEEGDSRVRFLLEKHIKLDIFSDGASLFDSLFPVTKYG